MNRTDLTKTTLGALVIGAGILSGNALALTVAGGIGVNWAAEGLGSLWQNAAAPLLSPGSPLTKAYERALRTAANDLKTSYERHHGPVAAANAFNLIVESAAAVAQAEIESGIVDSTTAQITLSRHLDDLLYGHDEQQVIWLRERLLAMTAVAFQSELETDRAAGDAFRTWLLQQMAAQTVVLTQTLADVPAVLAELKRPEAVLEALSGTEACLQAELQALRIEIERLAAQPPTAAPRSATFDNTGMTVQGGVTQVAKNQYIDSAHAQGDGAVAMVTNPSDGLSSYYSPSSPPTADLRDELEANLNDLRIKKARLQRQSDLKGIEASPTLLHDLDQTSRRIRELEAKLDILNQPTSSENESA